MDNFPLLCLFYNFYAAHFNGCVQHFLISNLMHLWTFPQKTVPRAYFIDFIDYWDSSTSFEEWKDTFLLIFINPIVLTKCQWEGGHLDNQPLLTLVIFQNLKNPILLDVQLTMFLKYMFYIQKERLKKKQDKTLCK